MSKTSSNTNERIDEIRAVAECQAILRSLDDLSREPNGKRFNKDRAERAEHWMRLHETTFRRAGSLAAIIGDKQRTKAPTDNGTNRCGIAVAGTNAV